MNDKKFTISGSEIGTILGFNPYENPMELYCRKMGLLEPKEETEAMRWGIEAEHVVARRYQKETGANLLPSVDEGFDRFKPLVHPDCPWWTGTPDRKIEPNGLLEIKIVGERSSAYWGDSPDGEVPDQYLLQCHWYMPLLNADYADLAVQIGNRDYRVYRINRDLEMESRLKDAALDFLENHLIPGIPPPIDGSEASRRYLTSRYPREEDDLIHAPETAEEWLESLAEAKRVLESAKSGKDYAENKLREIIGGHTGIVGYGWKATWKRNKDTEVVNWEGAFKRLCDSYITSQNSERDRNLAQDWIGDIKDECTTIKPGPRVLRVVPLKEK